MAKLRVTVVNDIEIDLKDYTGATTVADAARLQQKWADEGTIGWDDLLCLEHGTYSIKIEPIEDKE